MRTILIFLLAALAPLVCSGATNVNATFRLRLSAGTNFGSFTVEVQPTGAPRFDGSAAATGGAQSLSTTNGVVTFTNLLGGDTNSFYRAELRDPDSKTRLFFLCPATNFTLGSEHIVLATTTGGPFAWAWNVSDLRYVSGSLSNAVLTTNGGRVYLSPVGLGTNAASKADITNTVQLLGNDPTNFFWLNASWLTNATVALSNDVASFSNRLVTSAGTAVVTNNLTASNVWDRSNVKWWGAKGDGTTDDTVAWRAAVVWASNNHGRVFAPEGVYPLTNTIILGSGMSVQGAGAGTVLKKTASYSHVFANAAAYFRGTNHDSQITLSDFTVDVNANGTQTGACDTNENGHIQINYADNVTIRNVAVTNGDATLYSGHFHNVTNLTLTHWNVDSLKDGLHFGSGCKNVLVENCTLNTGDDAIAMTAVDFPRTQARADSIENVTIRNVRCTRKSGAGGNIAFLIGSWTNWVAGSNYWVGHMVVNAGNIYKMINIGTNTAANAPTHTGGDVTGADGITWRWLQAGTFCEANVSHVKIENISYDPATFAVNSYSADSPGYNFAISPGTAGRCYISDVSITGAGDSSLALVGNGTYYAFPLNSNVVQSLRISGALTGTNTYLEGNARVGGELQVGENVRLISPSPLIFSGGYSYPISIRGSQLRLQDAAGLGGVGIGTNSPQAALHIVGNGSTDKLLTVGTTAKDGLMTLATNGTLNVSNNVVASNVWDRSNVKWWGAKGDGTTDDTAAIQNCINASVSLTGSGLVKIPSGRYIITSPLRVSTYPNEGILNIEGDAIGLSILTNAASVGIIFSNAYVRAKDFTILSVFTNTCATFEKVIRSTFESVQFYGGTNGVQVIDASVGDSSVDMFRDCWFINCGIGFDAGVGVNSTRFVNCDFTSTGVTNSIGAILAGSANIMDHCTLQALHYGVLSTNTYQFATSIKNSYFETIPGAAIVSSNAITVSDNFFATAAMGPVITKAGYGLLGWYNNVLQPWVAMPSLGINYAESTNGMMIRSDFNTPNPGLTLNGISSIAGSRNWDVVNNFSAYGDFGIRQSVDTASTPSILRFIIGDTGNVGIGTNSPAATLHVAGNNAQNFLLQVGTTNSPSLLTLHTNGTLNVSNLTVLGVQGTAGQVLSSTGTGVAWSNNAASSLSSPAVSNANWAIIDSGAAAIMFTNFSEGVYSTWDDNGWDLKSLNVTAVGNAYANAGYFGAIQVTNTATIMLLSISNSQWDATGSASNQFTIFNQASNLVASGFSSNSFQPKITATNLATGADQTIALDVDSTVCVTNAVAGAVNVWLTNAVDRKWFVLRVLADGTARMLSFTNASGLTLNVVNTNGFSVTTLPQVPVTASKIATIAGRCWVIAGVTNVDLWGSVQQ